MLSFLWKVFYILFMLFCLAALILYSLIQVFLSHRQKRRFVYKVVRFWGRVTVKSTGSKVIITGMENIPPERNLCLVGNHQSNFDIPSLVGWLGSPLGFVAKQELMKVPVIYHWMKVLPCVFINRKTPRDAMKSFKESASVIASGNPIALFPEGTRAKSDTMGSFKAGSLKLPQMARATILPFAIKGSWRLFEIDGNIHSSTIHIRIFPPIDPTHELYNDRDALAAHLHSMIQNELETIEVPT